MPLFEYECRDCKSRFEQLVSNENAGVACRKCGSVSVNRLLSTFAVGGRTESTSAGPDPCSTCGAAERGMCGMN